MATIVITDLRNVSVDGVQAGAVIGVAVNRAAPAGELQVALEGWVKARGDEFRTRIAELQADKTKMQALIDAMGGTEEAIRLRRAARRQAALDAQAAAEAEAERQAAEVAAIDAEASA